MMRPHEILDDIQRASREGWMVNVSYDEDKLEQIVVLSKNERHGHGFTSRALVGRASTVKGALAKALERWADQ